MHNLRPKAFQKDFDEWRQALGELVQLSSRDHHNILADIIAAKSLEASKSVAFLRMVKAPLYYYILIYSTNR